MALVSMSPWMTIHMTSITAVAIYPFLTTHTPQGIRFRWDLIFLCLFIVVPLHWTYNRGECFLTTFERTSFDHHYERGRCIGDGGPFRKRFRWVLPLMEMMCIAGVALVLWRIQLPMVLKIPYVVMICLFLRVKFNGGRAVPGEGMGRQGTARPVSQTTAFSRDTTICTSGSRPTTMCIVRFYRRASTPLWRRGDRVKTDKGKKNHEGCRQRMCRHG